MAAPLRIGKLAAGAGVSIETIRYYQRRGLLQEPPKPLGGHRRYPFDTVKRVHFIKRAQGLGFTLSEIGALLRLDETSACSEARALAARKLLLIDHKMADLDAMRRVLARLVGQCDSSDGGAACPIIDALARE